MSQWYDNWHCIVLSVSNREWPWVKSLVVQRDGCSTIISRYIKLLSDEYSKLFLCVHSYNIRSDLLAGLLSKVNFSFGVNILAGCGCVQPLCSHQSLSLLPASQPFYLHFCRGGQKKVKAAWARNRDDRKSALEHSNWCWAVEPGLPGVCWNIQHYWCPRVRTQALFVCVCF